MLSQCLYLNEVLSIRAQELEASSRQSPFHGHLNEVLSIRAQEFRPVASVLRMQHIDLNEVLSIRAQEWKLNGQIPFSTDETSMKS